MPPAISDVASFLAGFVAGEGTFTGTRDGRRFAFAVGLGATDGDMCHTLRCALSAGHVYVHPRRKPHYDDEVTFTVQSLPELIEVVIPFMDAHLPPSYKRRQYLAWKEQLLDFWEHRAKRVRPCGVDGCEEPRRAHGLCRHHLYERHGV